MTRHLLGLLLFSLVLPLSARADSGTWHCVLGQQAYIGTRPLALDGYDGNDAQGGYGSYINIGVYHDQTQEDWTGPGGFYGTDIRAPLGTAAGDSKTWRLYYWNNSDAPAEWTETFLTWYLNTGGLQDKLVWTLTFTRLPIGMGGWDPPPYGSPVLGETVLLNDRGEGSWMLQTYRTTNGLDGYIFDLTATVIPEPSSLLALVTGLAGLGAFLRRRRSRV